MMRPQPPRPRMKRRNTVSVTPAIGARTVAGAISTLPMLSLGGNSLILESIVATGSGETKCEPPPSDNRYDHGGDPRMKIVQIGILAALIACGVLLFLVLKGRQSEQAAVTTAETSE